MTQKFINPLSKFTTDTLQSLPYSTLTFSVNGSSTAKAVYADKSKTTSLGAIVTSDSAGIFPPIWLDGTYRAILKNAAGVTMTGWPIDSVGDAQNFTAFSAWDSTFTYDITTNSFVTGSDGNYYQSIQNPNFNKDPISQPAYWTRIYFLPTWNANVNYAVDVLVIYNGLLYKSNATGINHVPPNLSFWDNVSFNASITGPFTATGAITGNALVATTSVTSATVVASGAITGATSTTTGLTKGGTLESQAGLVVAGAITGATTISASGQADITGGGTFGNTARAGATILDWYEEGTFTPTAVGATTAGAGTYGGFSRSGIYTRIGNLVYFSLNIGWSAHTGTGDLRITGLPFTPDTAAVNFAFSVSCYNYAFGAGKQLTASTNGGATRADLWLSDPAGGALTGAPMDTTLNSLFISGVYKV